MVSLTAVVLCIAGLITVVTSQLPLPAQLQAPANGTNILPNTTFPFYYYSDRGRRLWESLGFSVYLYTSPPDDVLAQFYRGTATGWFYGRYKRTTYEDQNTFGLPYPPSELVMPNFASSAYNGGLIASNMVIHVVVLEEFRRVYVHDQADAWAGTQFSITANWVIYNGTTN